MQRYVRGGDRSQRQYATVLFRADVKRDDSAGGTLPTGFLVVDAATTEARRAAEDGDGLNIRDAIDGARKKRCTCCGGDHYTEGRRGGVGEVVGGGCASGEVLTYDDVANSS